MKCERAQAWFSDLIDGSIGSAEKVVLEAHLRDCASCAEDVKRLGALWTAMDAMPDVPAPANLRATIWQRIEARAAQSQSAKPERRPKPLWVRGLAFVGAAAAVALLATVTVPGKFRPAGFFGLLGISRSQSDGACRSRIETAPDGTRTVIVSVELPTRDARRTENVSVSVRDARGSTYVADAPVANGAATATVRLPEGAVLPIAVTAAWESSGGGTGSLSVRGIR